MAGYQRFVAYVYEYLKGKKGSNCGFIKVEVRDQRCRMELHLKCSGMPAQADLRIYGFVRNSGLMDGHLLGNCKTGEGIAWCMVETDALNMNDSGVGLAKMGGLILVTDGGAFFGTEWDDIPIRPENFREIKKNPTERPEIGRAVQETDSSVKVEMRNETLQGKGTEEEKEKKAEKEAPRKEVQREERSQNEVPREEARRNEVAQEEARRNEAAWEEARRNEVPREEARRNEVAREETRRSEVPQEETRRNEVPQEETIQREAPKEEVPRSEMQQERTLQKEPNQEEKPQKETLPGETVPEEVSQKETPREAEVVSQSMPDIEGVPEEETMEEIMRESLKKPRPDPMPDSMQKIDLPPTQESIRSTRLDLMPEPMEKSDRNPTQNSAQRSGPDPMRNPGQRPAQQHGDRFLPFGDEEVRDCRKIQLRDLTFLNRKDLPLRNNRFLQYGYFNFGHLLICQRADGRYILGVPGGYDQQERFMANMFGFPYFKESRDIRLPKGRGGYWYRLINTPDFH